MMIIVLLAIWALGFFVLFTDPKGTSTRWASATAFVGGGGFLSAVIDETLLPFLQTHLPEQSDLATGLFFLSRVSSFVCQVGLPYAFLMFALHSGDVISKQVKRLFQYAALLGPLLMLAITPIYPVLQFNYWIMIAWVIPYFLCSCLLLILHYWREKDPLVKQSRFFTNILVILPMLFVFTTIYIMRTQNDYEAWRYNSWIVGIQFLLILLVSLKYGFLGVKLRVEKRRLNSTLRAITTGTQIVNHSIKNEVGKISLYADRIQSFAADTDQPELKEDVKVIIHSAQHILDMMNRIQSQLQDVVLKEETVTPAEIIHQVVRDLKPLADRQGVVMESHLDDRLRLYCDPVQFREVLTNLCTNAIEAMKRGGTLTLQMYVSKKHLVIAVVDTGPGISKENLPHVLDPFFSTKKSGHNFGLGLSYCYSIMQKHQGLLEITSSPGEGTTVFLYFPRKRLLHE